MLALGDEQRWTLASTDPLAKAHGLSVKGIKISQNPYADDRKASTDSLATKS